MISVVSFQSNASKDQAINQYSLWFCYSGGKIAEKNSITISLDVFYELNHFVFSNSVIPSEIRTQYKNKTKEIETYREISIFYQYIVVSFNISVWMIRLNYRASRFLLIFLYHIVIKVVANETFHQLPIFRLRFSFALWAASCDLIILIQSIRFVSLENKIRVTLFDIQLRSMLNYNIYELYSCVCMSFVI